MSAQQHLRNPGGNRFASNAANPPGNRRDSIRKITVLFTDVVGSSNYFKAYGDLAGREMLRRHQELASQPVIEHGGSVVKVLGDSVMAYFTEPVEALKAAVKIQKGFRGNNNGKDPRDQIRVRIGLHFGEGIVERGDIYGDVVNITAKFLPLIQGEQIAVSQELHDQVSGATWARFERLNPSTKNEILKRLVIYRVDWEENAALDPAVMTLVVCRPVWSLARENFEGVWKSLLDKKEGLWSQTPFRHFTLSDGSLAILFKKPSLAAVTAHNALAFLKKHMDRNSLPLIPLQVLIDTGQFMEAGELTLERFEEAWAVVNPGEISITPAAFGGITVPDGVEIVEPHGESGSGLYRLLPKGEKGESDSLLFMFQNAMVRGDFDHCFYCGDRRHRPVDCPSKQLPEVTHGLERLGYLPLEKINEIFFGYVNSAQRPVPTSHQGANNALTPQETAALSFFELKKVFQLRFFRMLWNSQSNHWNRITAQNEDPERGGLIWIGQDCIRVSNLSQAETVLENALAKFPGDFRALCANGFLHIEKNDLRRAKKYFKLALENADTNPRKIFCRFLLSRLHELCGETAHAEDHIRKILFMDALCSEALYVDMINKFKRGNRADAVRKLRKLVDGNRIYFVSALIDPELARYGSLVHPELKSIMKRAGNQADKLSQIAVEEMEVIERVLGNEASEIRTPRSYLEKIKELSGEKGYFSYLDIIYYATAIIQSAKRSHERGRIKLNKAYGRLQDRIRAFRKILVNYPYPSLLGSLPTDIAVVQKQVDQIRDVIRRNAIGEFKQALTQTKDLARVLDKLEFRIRRLEGLRRWIAFGTDLLKKTLILEGSIAFISLLLFPIVGHYLNFVLPEFSFSPTSIWKYQKGVLVLGGASGLFLAFLMSAKKFGDT